MYVTCTHKPTKQHFLNHCWHEPMHVHARTHTHTHTHTHTPYRLYGAPFLHQAQVTMDHLDNCLHYCVAFQQLKNRRIT